MRSSRGSRIKCTWRRRSIVLLALLWWHAVRARPLRWWLPLLVFGVAAFLIKEDGLMLLPVILLVHFITRKVSEPELPPAPWAFVALSLVTVAGLIALRDQRARRAWRLWSSQLSRRLDQSVERPDARLQAGAGRRGPGSPWPAGSRRCCRSSRSSPGH